MGNLSSVEEDAGLDTDEQKPAEDGVGPDDNLLDFTPLFNLENLYKAFVNLKEPPGDVTVRCKSPLVKWLKTLTDRGQTSVTESQFVSFLGPKSSVEEATELFHDLDAEESGFLEVAALLQKLNADPVDPMEALQPCYELPGCLDVYLGEKPKQKETAKNILQFIYQHRIESDRLVTPVISQSVGNFKQRYKLVDSRYYTLKQRDENFGESSENGDKGEGGGFLYMKKSYSKIMVSTSSSTKKMEMMLDGQSGTYWQSNGSPRSHWIRIFMLAGVHVKELAITVDATDDSYMPKTIMLSAGDSEGSLKEIKHVNVPRETTGKFVLLKNIGNQYRIFQINIRGCHSDGCDVRIRGLHIKGYKHMKESHISVTDSVVSWFMGVVAATAKTSMPVAPALRGILIAQSRTSLASLPPLSLSVYSSSKPEFLSSHVLKEMDKFVASICECEGGIDRDSLEVMVTFALAHGNTNKIIDILSILLRNTKMKLALSSVLDKTHAIVKAKKLKHAEKLKVQLSSCDGGQKGDEFKADNMFINTPSTAPKPYTSAEGNLIVAVSCQEDSDHLMSVTRFKVDVKASDTGAKAGLVFLSSDDLAGAKFKDEMSKFDSWTQEDYKSMTRVKGEGADRMPIAYFQVNQETRSIEFEADVVSAGRYLTIKFLGPLKEDAKHVTVNYVHMFGVHFPERNFKSLQAFQDLESIMTREDDEETEIEGGVVIVRLLYLLVSLLKDLRSLQTKFRLSHLDPTFLTEPHLEIDSLSLEKIWNLYRSLNSTDLDYPVLKEHGSFLALNLLRSSLPFIKQSPSSDSAGKDSEGLPEEVLLHLCNLLDADDTDTKVRLMVQEIVTEGVVVFFPDSKARMEYLFSMIGSVLEDNQPRSWWIKFEALCQYFSKTDSKSVLNLPTKPEEITDEKVSPTLKMLNTMIVVANREAVSTIATGTAKPDNLIHLLSAFQAGMFFWCRDILSEQKLSDETKKCVTDMINTYVRVVVENCMDILSRINEENKSTTAPLLQKSVTGRVFAELIVFLGGMVDLPLDFLEVLKLLSPILKALAGLHSSQPAIAEENMKHQDGSGEGVVGIWMRESPHNYENNSRVTEVFTCPSATKFSLEFDPRCHTERRYDYLQFIDESGEKRQFDGKLGEDRWPTKAEFKGAKVNFTFHSDGSNNEWGYKFILKAYGIPYRALPWISDLYMSLAHLMGRICGYVLTAKPRPPPIKAESKEEAEKEEAKRKEEEVLLNGEIWRTLFRGGCTTRKLTHSLSGNYTAMPADTRASSILHGLAEGSSKVGMALVNHCQEILKGQYYGGPLVDSTVNAVFAALVWNSQDCREELETLVVEGEKDEDVRLAPLNLQPSSPLLSAFKYAESMRRELVEMRQKVMEAKDEIEDEEKKAAVNEDAPVLACKEKAVYLLQFSGMSRNPMKSEGEVGGKGKPNWVAKNKNWNKLSMAVSTVGKLKHIQETSEKKRIQEKYPSFELVLSFVRNEALSVDQVSKLLDQRAQNARRISQVYHHCANSISTLREDNIYDLPGQLFMQQLLVRQHHIPRHYAAKLDGCGLELENQVRKAYRLFISQLVDSLTSKPKTLTDMESSSRMLLLVYLVHLLDFEWQEYDHTMINELGLPEFLYHSSVNCSGVKEIHRNGKFTDEEEMLRRYRVHMKLMKSMDVMLEMGTEGSWKELLTDSKDEQELKDTHQFLIGITYKYKNVIAVKCDKCGDEVRGLWYRDMDITEDLDLCTSCFKDSQSCEHPLYDKDHLFMLLGRFYCDGCKMHIFTDRFHSNTRNDFDLCLGCFRLEEESGGTDDWTVFRLKEMKATEKSNRYLTMHPDLCEGCSYKEGVLVVMGPSREVGVYTQHHCWLLFNVLTLAMASVVNNSSGGGLETHQASNIKLMCLKLLAFTLRASLLAKYEEEDKEKKKSAEDLKKKSSSTESSSDKEGQADSEKSKKTSASGEKGAVKEKEQSKETPSELDSTADKEGKETASDLSPKESKNEETKKAEQKPSSSADAKPAEDKPTESKATEDTDGEKKLDTPCEEVVEEEDPVSIAGRKPLEMDARIGELEKAHGVIFLEKALGLLAAILPQDTNQHLWIQHRPGIEQYLVEELIPIVLQLACCMGLKESLRLQALLVSAQYLSHLTPEGADVTIDVVQGIRDNKDDSSSVSSDSGTRTYGSKTAQFFFNKGATFLTKSKFSGAATCADCLLQLSKSLPWRSVVTLTLSQCLQTRPQDMDSTSIFGLLVLSGFPRIPREGGVVCTSISDKPSCVVLGKVDGNSASGIDATTRKPVQVKLSEYVLQDVQNGCIDETKLDTLLGLLRNSFQLCRQESDGQVEHMWILALLLKALQFIIQNSSSTEVIMSLFQSGLIPKLVKLASRPTLVSKNWHLTDLEVLCISSYLPSKSGKDKESTEEGKESSSEKAKDTKSASLEGKIIEIEAELSSGDMASKEGTPMTGEDKEKDEEVAKEKGEQGEGSTVDVSIEIEGSVAASQEPEVDPEQAKKEEEEKRKEKEQARILDGLSDDDKTMLKTMVEVFVCDLTVVRAMFEEAEGDMAKFLTNSEKFFENGEFTPSPEILEAAEKWKSVASSSDPVEGRSAVTEDTGVTRIYPLDVDLTTVEALTEDASIFKKAKNLLKDLDKTRKFSGISSSSATILTGDGDNDRAAKREDSYRLLWEELSKDATATSQDSLRKTVQGVAVLRARQVLACVLRLWPRSGPKLGTTTLGCVDIIHYFCLLDLLLDQQSKDEKEKMLLSVFGCGEMTETLSLAETAAQCMNTVYVNKERKEYRHGPKDGKPVTDSGRITIENATGMEIRYYPINGSVTFSSTEAKDDQLVKVKGSVTKTDSMAKHRITGNSVFYEVELSGVSEAKYPKYNFTVYGIQEGRFDTGYAILELLVNKEELVELLPVQQMWPLLVGVACQHSGRPRLKVLELLLHIIQLYSKDQPLHDRGRVELSALKPLWQLFTNTMRTYETKSKSQLGLAPDVLRLLMELFLSVENLSQEWGQSEELMMGTLSSQELHRWLEKGVSNVAYVSIALGLDNLAAKTFIEERLKPPSEKKASDGGKGKSEDEDEEDEDGHHSYSDNDDDDDDDTDDDTDDDDSGASLFDDDDYSDSS